MKFREYDDLLPRTITGRSEAELDEKLQNLAMKYDFIDLQFAITDNIYAALALLRKRDNKCIQ